MARNSLTEIDTSETELFLEFADGSLGRCVKTAYAIKNQKGEDMVRFFICPTEKTQSMLAMEDKDKEADGRYDQINDYFVMDIPMTRIIELPVYHPFFKKWWILQDWRGEFLDPTGTKFKQQENMIRRLTEERNFNWNMAQGLTRKMRKYSKHENLMRQEAFNEYAKIQKEANPAIEVVKRQQEGGQ